MSDIGLIPPGFIVWIFGLGFLVLGGAICLISLLIAWLRTRNNAKRFSGDRFVGYAVGGAISLLATGASMLLIDWSGSLGKFARWIDQPTIAGIWVAMLLALWPAVAFLFNRRQAKRI